MQHKIIKKLINNKTIGHFEFEIDNLWEINQDYCYEFNNALWLWLMSVVLRIILMVACICIC